MVVVCEPFASQPFAFCQNNYEHLSEQTLQIGILDWKSISWLDQISIGISSLEKPIVGPVGLSLLTQDWDGYYLDRFHFAHKSNPHLVLSLTHFELMLCHRM